MSTPQRMFKRRSKKIYSRTIIKYSLFELVLFHDAVNTVKVMSSQSMPNDQQGYGTDLVCLC